MLIQTAAELMSFSAGEENEVEKQVRALSDAGVNVCVAAGKFGDLYLHFLNKYKMMGVRLTSKFDLRRLCRTLGAQPQARLVRHCKRVLACTANESYERHSENEPGFPMRAEAV